MDRQIISLAPQTFHWLPPLDFVRIAADAGYRHIGMRTIPVDPRFRQPDMACFVTTESETRALSAAMADAGICAREIESLALNPDVRIADSEPGLALAAMLGGEYIVATSDDPDPVRRGDRFTEFGELARTYGLKVLIEFVPWREIGTLERACDAAMSDRSGNTVVMIDALHLDRSAGTAADAAAADPRLIACAQLCDAPAERPADHAERLRQAFSERAAPGEGGLDLLDLLRGLPPSIPISLEVPNPPHIERIGAVAHARHIREATERLLRDLHHTAQ